MRPGSWPTLFLFLLLLFAAEGKAQERSITLAVSPVLQDTGFLKFLLPRFSLKHSIRVNVMPLQKEAIVPGDADVILTSVRRPMYPGASEFVGSGKPALSGFEQMFYVLETGQRGGTTIKHAARFSKWLLSEIGQRTVEDFALEYRQVFKAGADADMQEIEVVFGGDATIGAQLSLQHCGRCHVVSEKNRMNGLGSTPSFALLRTFSDWDRRFEAFFTLNPHPAFTQIDGITEPFDISHPSPISPLQLTLNDLDAILAYVAKLEPADLGAPIRHQ
ncbi:MAG: cytochrome c [Rhodobacteraceae bacterium]|nr:cytochrome c [Paracoccaceae bacterium]